MQHLTSARVKFSLTTSPEQIIFFSAKGMLKRKKKNCTHLILDFGTVDEGLRTPRKH